MAGKASAPEIVHSIGDDCAILQFQSGEQLLVTTDLCVEDVHFRRKWHPAQSVGHRCLARGLSDIAAMGGKPVACFLSLGVPSTMPQKWADEFLRGLLRLARKFKMSLAGGDTSSAEKITADILILGTVPAGKAVLRSGARPGDHIYVTGEVGGAAAELKRLFAGKKIQPKPTNRHFYPTPRIEIGQWLRQKGVATAMIDISDGLSVDLSHICKESRVSALVEASAIPAAKGATKDLALHGGDDYELLFTARPRANVPARIGGVPITRIGTILQVGPRHSVLQIRNENGRIKFLKPTGWQHFAKI